ncbi:MAG: signal transduction histidine kinase/class 3 adenylate cyclase/ActR, partial [Kiritimatiellia bacterium]
QTSVTMHMADAVGEMLQVMALLGIDIAPAQSMEELGALVGRALGVFGDQSDAQILDRPAMTSAEHIAAQRVLASSLPAATMAAPMIHLPAVVTGMELAAEHGLSGHACTPLAHLAIVLCSSGHYNLGYRFGCLATGVAERFPEHQVTDNLIVFPIFVQHWIEPISNAAAGLEEAARRTFDLGHVGGFGYAINSAFVAKLQAGEDLRSLLELYPRWVASAAAAKQDIAVVSLSLWAQQMRCMVGEAPDSSVLGGALYESSVTLPFLIDNGVGPAILYDTLASCELAWRFADPERVLELCEARWQIVDTPGNGGMYSYVLLTTLKAMAQLATLHEQPDEAARVAVLEQVDAHRQRLTVWAEHCPANHGSRHALLEAERARVDGDNDTAGGLYDESIRLARLHAMPAEAATAAERAASFYRSSNRTIGARAYATEAVFSWEEMGATAVATHVRRTYDDVLTGERASGEELDVKALLRASEAMTGEPALDRLLKKLVDIVTTVAGAQRAVLAIERDGELLIEAHGGGDEISVMIGEPVDGWSDAPAEVLNYVHRTGRTLLLHDPVNEGRFTAAPYVRRAAPRSILAISLEHQGVRTGVVYLENNLTTHAFTSDRVRMLQALSSQAATAIENARLVGDLQARTQELARKNEQLTELDELRDEFLAKTSHELRTPLHGIMGLAQSMMEGTENASSLHDLSLIVASGRRLSNLVNDILDLSTLKKRELVVRERAMSLYDVASAVVGLAAPMALGKPVAVVNSVPEDCPTVMADSERVEQVLLNLVGNAIKFTSHGSVEVGVDAAVDGRVRIWVRDTGIGISNEAQGRIFSAFEQGSAGIVQDYGGAGLGLSVAQELVQLHGSELVVRSELGQGSTFSFELVVTEGVVADVVRPSLTHRAVQQVLHKSDKAPRANADTGRGFHVLVVDDEPVNLQVLDNYLGRQGYRVTTASGGAQALGLIDEGLSPDIVLLDVMMPGMDGFEVCRKLREDSDSGTLPVVMVTARSRSQDVVRGLQAGANDYVTKPFSSVEVAARIQTHVQLSNIHGAVGRFVPRSFLDLLGRDSIVDVRLGDSIEREMTVLYSDIRGFNGLSKGMTPTESFDFINAYLGLMEPVVSACGGFIDKYLGDGIMALFDRPSDAVKAGVMMHRTLDGFNTQRKASGQAPVRVGVGVHTGMLMLGTVGGELRMDTTVISDAVALAYRVEDTTKRFGTGLIITSSTFAELDERAFEIRWLDRMSLVDRQHKINIYDVFEAAEPHVRAARSASQATFEQAVDLFHNRQFEGAGELFSVVEAMDPNDRAVQVYLERCATISRQFTSI